MTEAGGIPIREDAGCGHPGTMEHDRFSASIDAAVGYMSRSQLDYGEFRSYISPDENMQEDCVFDSSPFITSLILYSIGFVEDSRIETMKSKALGFLRDEMEWPGIWRYWTSRNAQHKLIPPDMDDICCISHAFARNGIPFPDNRKLILANRNREGLFYTWFVLRWQATLNPGYWLVTLREGLSIVKLYLFWKKTEAQPDDIDAIVNANALLYLGESETTRPVIEYLIRLLDEGKEDCSDKWHLNRFTFYYMLSRAYFEGASSLGVTREEIIRRLKHHSGEDGSIGNVMETAMAACTLLNFNCRTPLLDRAIEHLLSNQQAGGEWPRYALYFGGPKRIYGWGSEEISTGYALEALARYSRAADS